MWLIKLFVFALDLLLLPFYLIIQKPWKNQQKKKIERSFCKIINDSEALITDSRNLKPDLEGKIETIDFDLINNMDEFFQAIVDKYQHMPCFGSRRKLGKVFVNRQTGNEENLNQVQYGYTFENSYQWLSYVESNDMVEVLSKCLMTRFKISAGDKVMICAESRAEWMLAAFAIFRCGGVLVAMAPNIIKSSYQDFLLDAQPKALITVQALAKTFQDTINDLDRNGTFNKIPIIYIEDPFEPLLESEGSPVPIIPYAELEASCQSSSIGVTLPKISDTSTADTLAAIFFTSGSGGKPKGVKFNHINLIRQTYMLVNNFPKGRQKKIGGYRGEVAAAILPLSHILEFSFQIVHLAIGTPLGYSSPFTMFSNSPLVSHGQLGDFVILKPTSLVAVPLVLNRIYDRVQAELKYGPFLRSAMFSFFFEYKQMWTSWGYNTPLVDIILFSRFRKLFGGKLDNMLVGGAPIKSKVKEFMNLVFCMKIVIGYGCTEVAGGITSTDTSCKDTDTSIGYPLTSIVLKLVSWMEGGYSVTDTEGPSGEIHIHGPGISMGYLSSEGILNEESEDSPFYFDNEGKKWYKTGDIGRCFKNAETPGTVHIVDRKSLVKKLQNGKFMCISVVEDALQDLAFVDFIMIHVDSNYGFPVALIVPNKLEMKNMAKDLGMSPFLNWEQLCSNDQLKKAAQKKIEEALKNKFMGYEIPRKIALISDQWTPESGMLTGALKLCRKEIGKNYHSKIQELFSQQH